MPPIVKTVYFLCRKSSTQFGLNFSVFLLCKVKILDEKNTRHVYLLGEKYTVLQLVTMVKFILTKGFTSLSQ